MKIINLTDLEKSDIKYKISKFPDGQQNITLNPEWDYTNLAGENNPRYGFRKPTSYNQPVQIKSRLNNFRDLEIIIATVACLKELGCFEIHLYVPYFVGARSDRKFEEGGNWYLKQVICPIINSLKLASITVLDAHSWILGNLLNNYKAIDNEHLVSHFAIPEIIKNMNFPTRAVDEYHTTPKDLYYDKRGFDNIVLISPDAGASHKIEKIAKALGYTGDIITCTKERDNEGNLTQTNVPLRLGEDFSVKDGIQSRYWNDKDFIIIDDICDGGRTFINIAKKIKAQCENSGYKNIKIYLIITHGIFSAGFEKLSDVLDGIYCTNSYSDIYKKQVEVQSRQQSEEFVKQLNIF